MQKNSALLHVLKAMTENQPCIADPYLIAFDIVTQDKLRTVFMSFMKYICNCAFLVLQIMVLFFV